MKTIETAVSAPEQISNLQLALRRVLKSLVLKTDPESPLIELPISQLRCLYTVAEQQGRKMHDLCETLRVGLPAVSQIVDRLVRRELIERRADPQDRRVVRLHLTHHAQAILDDASNARDARMAATLSHLSTAEIKRVTRALETIAQAAEKVEATERDTAPPISAHSDPMVELMSRRTGKYRGRVASIVSPTALDSGQMIRGLGVRRPSSPRAKLAAKPQ